MPPKRARSASDAAAKPASKKAVTKSRDLKERVQSNANLIQLLPRDVLVHVLSMLFEDDLARLMCVDQLFSTVTRSEELWRRVCDRLGVVRPASRTHGFLDVFNKWIVRWWTGNGASVTCMHGSRMPIRCVHVDVSQGIILAGSRDGFVSVWQAPPPGFQGLYFDTPAMVSLGAHGGPVSSMHVMRDIGADRKILVGVSRPECHVALWTLAGTRLQTYGQFVDSVFAVKGDSGAGTAGVVVAGGGQDDCTSKVWDLQSGAELLTLQHRGSVRGVHLNCLSGGSPHTFWTASLDAHARLFDLRVGQSAVGEFFNSGAGLHAVQQHRERLLTCSGRPQDIVRIWDVRKLGAAAAAAPSRSAKAPVEGVLFDCKGHSSAVSCGQFDSSKIVSGSYDGTVRVWSATNGRHLHTLKRPIKTTGTADKVQSVSFDGLRLAVGYEQPVRSEDGTAPGWNVCAWDLGGE
jgi:WD40 repeat protein